MYEEKAMNYKVKWIIYNTGWSVRGIEKNKIKKNSDLEKNIRIFLVFNISHNFPIDYFFHEILKNFPLTIY